MLKPACLLIGVIPPAVSPAAAQAPAAGLFAEFEAARTRILALRESRDAATPAEARALVQRNLAGSGVPDSYVDSVFDDPRSSLYPDIPGRFGGPSGPAPEPTYEEYRRSFITEARVAAGMRLAMDRRDLLRGVEERFGVDGTLLVALAGVETFYGGRVGSYRVFDALDTIIQKVPRRSAWAAREAAAFLRMTYADGLDAHGVVGSYAGAFGLVQFMPSSFERAAVDLDGDGRRRLDEWPDALGSAANYLVLAGYKSGAPFEPASPIGRALFAYNHSDNYVRVILELRAEILKRLP